MCCTLQEKLDRQFIFFKKHVFVKLTLFFDLKGHAN